MTARRIRPGKPPATGSPRWLTRLTGGLANVPFEQRIALVGAVLLGIGLYLVSSYLSSRFDRGSPVSHSVDPYLTIWLSLFAVVVVLGAWIIATLAPTRRARTSPRRPDELRRGRNARLHSRRA